MIIRKARAVYGWPPLLEATDSAKEAGEGWEQSSGEEAYICATI
jgi:hypothetical protein